MSPASEAVGNPGFWDGLAIIGGQLDAADAAARAAGRLSRQKLARSTAWSSSAVLPIPGSPISASVALSPDRARANTDSISACSRSRPSSMRRFWHPIPGPAVGAQH